MDTITVRSFSREGIIEQTINVCDIKRFGITNTKTYTRVGGFKKYVKYSYVDVNGVTIKFKDTDIIKDLKLFFGKQAECSKNAQSVQKLDRFGFSNERKAIDYHYTVKN